MEKILLAIDGSKSCNKAIREVSRLCEALQAEITIITVIEENISLYVSTKKEATNTIDKYNLIDEKAKNMISSCENTLMNKSNKVKKVVKKGKPSEVICQEAVKGDYDLVVLADMGKNAVKKFLLGSTTEKVVRHCKKSVLIAK